MSKKEDFRFVYLVLVSSRPCEEDKKGNYLILGIR